MALHVAANSSKGPLMIGLTNALFKSFHPKEVANEIIKEASIKAATLKLSSVPKALVNSNENMLQSMNVYYSHNVMGKRKYSAVRTACKSKSSTPLVGYRKLALHMSNIDIGFLGELNPTFTSEDVKGRHRDILQYMPRLAKFYLQVNLFSEDKLTFPYKGSKRDPNSYVILLVVGGDGTPGVGTTYHTFVNVGKRIASSFEIFMIFWAECSEDSDLVRKYILKLTKDLVELEKNVYHVNVKGVQYPMEFRVSLMSNNMKNVAFLAGQLANSALYFS